MPTLTHDVPLIESGEVKRVGGNETTSWSRTFIDKAGARATARSFRSQDLKALQEMYFQFEPKQIAQRMPPRTEEQISRWLYCLTHDGENFVALVGRRLVGHTVLCNLQDGRAELAIFVLQEFQNRGIGTQLIQLAKRAAMAAAYRQIWISVESSNLQAIRVFQKNSFQFIGSFDTESEMVLDLTPTGRQTDK
ncbi:MAG: GNAT family N-acetyltransferase [Acidobacteriia bacterium]|nr:GNAT family N-acetyltransferase [Terriglobia bacterium]